MLVAFLGVGLFGGLLLAVGVIIPAYQARQATRTDEPGTPYGFVLLNFPPGENVKTVTIDGQGVILRPGAENQWSMHAAPGPHTLFVDFSTDSALNQVKTFKTTINVSAGRVTEIDAVPVVELKVPNNDLTTIPAPDPKSAAGEGLTAPVDPAQLRSDAPNASTPLADAVEVLTDPAQMPEYEGALVDFSEPKVRVWIDEPGLIISLKRLDFDGPEGSGLMYDSRNTWGVDSFREARTGKTIEVPPGRYQVLVQDLDYGWSIDQRGTIQIGNGVQTVHVRRRFPELKADGYGFPLPFRWAGKLYEIMTADQVSTINGYLARLSGNTSTGSAGPESFFIGHPLLDQIVIVQPPGHQTLKYQPSQVRLKLEGNNTLVQFRHDQGAIRWSHSVPEGFIMPPGAVTYRVSYQNFSWPGAKPELVIVDPLVVTSIVIPPLSRMLIKEMVMKTADDDSGLGNEELIWFRQYPIYIPSAAIPVARKLVLAWVDGKPDISESELLAIANETSGSSYTWETLWQYPAVEIHLMPSILVPGSTPGTWRIKEPPDGAVSP